MQKLMFMEVDATCPIRTESGNTTVCELT